MGESELEKQTPVKQSKSDANPDGITKVFIGNVPWSIDDDSTKDFFKDCGSIEEIFWIEDKESGKFKGCGFVTFSTAEAATKALELNGQDFGGRPIKCELSQGRKSKPGTPAKKFEQSAKPAGCTTIFFGNLSYD